jgi:pilus assembly protein CpaF
LAQVPPGQRIVVIEEATELVVAHPHLVRLEARAPNAEGRGAFTLTDLVRQALRMRPDRIVVGECRGAEVRELLLALNTGHGGSCGTIHANSTADVPARLEALGALAGMDAPAVAAQAGAALAAVVHMARDQAGTRRVDQVAVLRQSGSGLVAVPALSLCPAGTERAEGWDHLAQRCGWHT